LFEVKDCKDSKYVIKVHPTDNEDRAKLMPFEDHLLVSISTQDLIEPIAVQIKFEGGGTGEKQDKQSKVTEYTVFMVRPMPTPEFCQEYYRSCICRTNKPCRADKSFFCKDDRFTLLALDTIDLHVHHLF
jgi:hypothetical protein